MPFTVLSESGKAYPKIKMKRKPNSGLPPYFSGLFPIIGMGLFLLCYAIATLHYPGGSWSVPDQEGFSFWHNYLCDLLDIHAINGEINTARFYAIFALASLCIGLFWLWFHLPRLFNRKSFNQKVMRASGLFSIFTIFFLALGNHDTIVRIAGLFGVIAFITCSVELHKECLNTIFLLGIICLLVFLVNYYICQWQVYVTDYPMEAIWQLQIPDCIGALGFGDG